jgi:hypothetical protein
MPLVSRLYRYPVKGLSAEPLAAADLEPGQPLPHDRRFAIAHGASRFDPAHPAWQDKRQFVTLMTHERLAELRSAFDETTGVLTVTRHGRQVARGNVTKPMGRDLINQFLAAFIADRAPRPVRLVEAPGIAFADTRDRLLSLINLASLADLERITRKPVDPLRFRGNLYIEGAEPWEEQGWAGREAVAGTARLRLLEPIERCAATTVDPETAERDINIPKALMAGFGHTQCGVYAEVIQAGRVSPGDPLTPA